MCTYITITMHCSVVGEGYYSYRVQYFKCEKSKGCATSFLLACKEGPWMTLKQVET